jgi:NarL family two-component system response regulator LiaR
MIRVLLADDHNLVRQGISALLEKENDIEVVGQSANGQEAIDLVKNLKPEVVVMDLSMPRMDGTQATERILGLKEAPAIVILSVHSDSALAQQLIRQGVKGYLLKMSTAEELPLAIRAASRGELYLSPAITDSVISTLIDPVEKAPESTADLLSPREREVLQLVSEGHTNNAIADALTISLKTVEKHRANLMAKLDVHDLPNLMRTAIKQGLILDES